MRLIAKFGGIVASGKIGHENEKNSPQGRLGGREHIWRVMENKKKPPNLSNKLYIGGSKIRIQNYYDFSSILPSKRTNNLTLSFNFHRLLTIPF